MKILHVINGLNMGGAENMLLNISLLMNKNKKNIIEVLLLSNKETYLKSLFEDNNVKVHMLNNKNNYSVLIFFMLINYMRKYDIIHAHLFPANYWVSLTKIFLKNKVIITTEHNTHNKRRDHSFFRHIERFIYSKYSKVISISNKTQENLLDWLGFVDNKKFIVIENGVDISQFSHAEMYGKNEFFTDNSFLMVMVGSFSLQKDQETIIRAMKLLPSHVKLLLVGDGNKKRQLIELIENLGLNERVKLLGIRRDIPSILKTSDIVLVSSNWEGFGLVAVEGMAAHKPVIASNVDGLKQVVDGFGVIFEKGNEKDLAKKIIGLMDNTNHYDEIAEKCYAHSKNYAIEKLVNKYVSVYEKCI